MELHLSKKPQKCTIIEGFPGFGLVGTIVTEFLINHLEVEEIGQIILKDSAPIVAIHDDKLVKPITFYYNKKYNLLLIHSISPGAKKEWDISRAIIDIAKQVSAKQIISIEGVMSQIPEKAKEHNVFYYSNDSTLEKSLQKLGIKSLKEGIVVGVTAALLTRNKYPLVSFFAETASQLPDARAAANVIKILDSYLGLKIDPDPLMKQAELFEVKLKKILEKGNETNAAVEQKQMNYVG